MKKNILQKTTLILLVLSLVFTAGCANYQDKANAKNVIFMVADGQSAAITTMARWYAGEQSLALDEMACGLVRTYAADSAITDSAPAATAYATGHKSHTGYIGVLPDVANMPGLDPIPEGDERKPVATLLEAARLAGKSTGIISTSELMHATPASFTSHFPDRRNYDVLSEHQVYQDADVMLGGGSQFFTSEARNDGEDLIAEIVNNGYDYITTPEEMKNSDSKKLWGMFADTAMAYDFDRDPAKEPSLAEMTEKAISVLSQNKDGFFLLVEGSKVDWAAHANDPIGVISDTLAFDNAVKTALEFAKSDKNTVVIAVTDHGTGGITIGSETTNSGYDQTHIDEFLETLKRAKLTGEGVEKMLNDDRSNIEEVMAEYYGIHDLDESEIKAIETFQPGTLNYTIGRFISQRANIGWTTSGHTGEDVPLYIFAHDMYKIGGVVENTDVAKYIETLLGVDLEDTTSRLFVPAQSAFEQNGAQVSIDDSDSQNPVFVAEKDGKILRLPINKNLAFLNDDEIKLDGLVVDNGITTFVPQYAVDLLQ